MPGGEWGLVSLPVFKTGAPWRHGGRVRFPSASAIAPDGDHSSVSFVFMGFTTATGETDGMNVVYFRGCDGCGAASVDKRVRRTVNSEFDVFINANEDWSTDLTCPTQDSGGPDLQASGYT